MAEDTHHLPLLCLGGPTASGKSALALALAESLNGEIVSVDSMQVYRGLDIGTAKPTPAERQRVPHHLLDVAELQETFDAARFVRLAEMAVTDIRSRGHLPILCGGTGFYFKAFLHGLGEGPGGDPQLRAQLEATPLALLLEELAQKDPVAHARIDQKNPRRVVRAVEVIRLTGQPFSAQQPPPSSALAESGRGPVLFFALERGAAGLRERIDRRVDQMFAAGLVEETRQLLPKGFNPTALQAIGYRQVVEHLQGERSLSETVELVKVRTRQFAKRQLTWFRHQSKAEWISLETSGQEALALEKVLRRLGNYPPLS